MLSFGKFHARYPHKHKARAKYMRAVRFMRFGGPEHVAQLAETLRPYFASVAPTELFERVVGTVTVAVNKLPSSGAAEPLLASYVRQTLVHHAVTFAMSRCDSSENPWRELCAEYKETLDLKKITQFVLREIPSSPVLQQRVLDELKRSVASTNTLFATLVTKRMFPPLARGTHAPHAPSHAHDRVAKWTRDLGVAPAALGFDGTHSIDAYAYIPSADDVRAFKDLLTRANFFDAVQNRSNFDQVPDVPNAHMMFFSVPTTPLCNMKCTDRECACEGYNMSSRNAQIAARFTRKMFVYDNNGKHSIFGTLRYNDVLTFFGYLINSPTDVVPYRFVDARTDVALQKCIQRFLVAAHAHGINGKFFKILGVAFPPQRR